MLASARLQMSNLRIPHERIRKFFGWELLSFGGLWAVGWSLIEIHRFSHAVFLFSLACFAGGIQPLLKAYLIRSWWPWKTCFIILIFLFVVFGQKYLMGIVSQSEDEFYSAKLQADVTATKQLAEELHRQHPGSKPETTPKKEDVIAPSEQHPTQDAVERERTVKSKNMIPKEILDQWKRDAPRQWRKNPLGQSTIGLQQTFEAGICDQGVPDLTKEIPGPWQNWGLQGARFGCPSNQFATQGTIDFDPKGFSYASTRTLIPSNFSSETMDVSIAWYSERTDGYVKWVVDRACVGSGQILRNAELIDAADILVRPNQDHSLNVSLAKVSLGGCKPKDTLILRLARNGEDNDDTLSAKAHVEKMSLDMR